MKVISSTKMRKDISEIINEVKYAGQVFGIERRNKVEAIIMKYSDITEITKINSVSPSFSFLDDEPDLYSIADIKKKYA